LTAPYQAAYDYLCDWRNMPNWVINFVKGIGQENDRVNLTSPTGDVPIQWRANRELGTIDTVFPGNSVLPTRLTAIGDSILYTFTFSVPSEPPDEIFHQSQAGIDEELQTLKRILEA